MRFDREVTGDAGESTASRWLGTKPRLRGEEGGRSIFSLKSRDKNHSA